MLWQCCRLGSIGLNHRKSIKFKRLKLRMSHRCSCDAFGPDEDDHSRTSCYKIRKAHPNLLISSPEDLFPQFRPFESLSNPAVMNIDSPSTSLPLPANDFWENSMDSEPTMPGSVSQSEQILQLDFDFDLKSMYFDFPRHLVFVDRWPASTYRYKVLEADLSECNTGVHSLDVRDSPSLAVVRYEGFLCGLLLDLKERSQLVVNSSAERSWKALKFKVLQEARRLDRLKGKEWEIQKYSNLNSATFVRSGKYMFHLFCSTVFTIH